MFITISMTSLPGLSSAGIPAILLLGCLGAIEAGMELIVLIRGVMAFRGK